MTVYYRGELGVVQQQEFESEHRKFPIEVGTDEAQTVRIAKPSDTTYGRSSSATCQARVTGAEGTQYELTLPQADLDEDGILFVKCSGSTDQHYGYVVVGRKYPTDAAQRFKRSV